MPYFHDLWLSWLEAIHQWCEARLPNEPVDAATKEAIEETRAEIRELRILAKDLQQFRGLEWLTLPTDNLCEIAESVVVRFCDPSYTHLSGAQKRDRVYHTLMKAFPNVQPMVLSMALEIGYQNIKRQTNAVEEGNAVVQ